RSAHADAVRDRYEIVGLDLDLAASATARGLRARASPGFLRRGQRIESHAIPEGDLRARDMNRPSIARRVRGDGEQARVDDHGFARSDGDRSGPGYIRVRRRHVALVLRAYQA